ncbi:hypothetical protein EGW08_001820 [Elysia chlorotica]|uniref:3-dehydrosphinganine reductase n=1 Tax=Elysia chlorotica TaxID=188477 RepID=A0A3S1BSF2_ELYCH|nr:hypothetical protein EGW08_001820 [Elysia chlorotica]
MANILSVSCKTIQAPVCRKNSSAGKRSCHDDAFSCSNEVTGGSSGIGKSLAILAVKRGAKVTIVARNKDRLVEAQNDISSHGAKEQVQIVSVDLSADFEEVQKSFNKAESTFGHIQFLINCAGSSIPGRFEELPISTFQKMMDINYMSAVHATRAVIAGMKSRCEGRIVFVSSQAGQLGLYGYTSYSASKFALRGLAEALQMEISPYNIRLTLAFPPDTNTPGFAEEQKGKPEETKLISETSGLFSPEKVAQTILDDTVRGRFFSSIGLDGWMLANVTCGFSPSTSVMEVMQQSLTMGLFRIVSIFYLYHFDKTVKECKLRRNAESKNR